MIRGIATYLFMSLLILAARPAHATHIIGAELSYRCLNPNLNLYELTLDFYRDCKPTSAEADTGIYFSLYDTAHQLQADFRLVRVARDTLSNISYQQCLFAPPATVCVERTRYRATTIVPIPPGGGYFTWERCCRNSTIVNLIKPLETGATWWIDLPDPDSVKCNNSPVFKLYPPTFICVGEVLLFDHSAVDPDGDSIVYEMCEALNGGLPNTSAPKPSRSKALFNKANYSGNYTYLNAMGGIDSFRIDSATGLLQGTAPMVGQYVMAVCIKEYRNGVLINTTIRDFQFNVIECDSVSTASSFYDQPEPCNTSIVEFENNSSNYHFIHWDFGVPGITSDTSSEFEPTYVFPHPGTFQTILYINKGLPCEDSSMVTIVVEEDSLVAGMIPDSGCTNEQLQFWDQTVLTQGLGNLISWDWDFGNGTGSSDQHPIHAYPAAGLYNVKLVVQTDHGCKDSTTGVSEILQSPTVDAGPDHAIILNQSVMLSGSGSADIISFIWSPGSTLDDPMSYTPMASPGQTTSYILTAVNEFGCTHADTATVFIDIPVELDVPNAFTPNGDGLNDLFHVYDLTGFDGLGLEHFKLSIYNRLGEKIYESTDFAQGWDGRHMVKGKDMETEVYAWVLNFKALMESEPETRFGDVALIR